MDSELCVFKSLFKTKPQTSAEGTEPTQYHGDFKASKPTVIDDHIDPVTIIDTTQNIYILTELFL